MKKIYPIMIVGIIVFSGFGAFGISNDYSILNMNNEPVPELIINVYGGFGITLIIKNVGDVDATNVSTFIGIFGGKPMSKNSDIKHLDDISPGKSVIVRFRFLGFGIGLFEDTPVVQAKAWCDEGEHYETDMNAWILFNLIILR
ncbi:MAG: hypothetical protein JSV67_03220 [Thermoplasmatales archaeon]|nr:MAG: hypothetical protein JSV67_03220 [Thermoplasmatales archaeon]